MPAKDIIHEAVKNALIKDGWTITHDPFTLKIGDDNLFADLAAEKWIVAERREKKIVVEIKSFLGPSLFEDLKVAIGQYIIYQTLLPEVRPEYKLYLAVNDVTYINDFQRQSVALILMKNKVALLVVDVESEDVMEWIR